MLDYIRGLQLLVAGVRNPYCIILDRMNLLRNPYVAHLRNGLKVELRPNSGDRFGFYEIMLRGDYTKGGPVLKPGDTVIDVGANIGCFSMLASSLVGPTGRVIALEPELSTFEQLRKNIALNQAENVTPLRLALSNDIGTTELYSGDSMLFSSMFDSVDGRNMESLAQKVPTMSLSQLMWQEKFDHCDYLKLDCEGAEYQILDAVDEELGRKITQVVIEIHTIPGREPTEITSKLENLGFSLVNSESVYFFRRQSEHQG